MNIEEKAKAYDEALEKAKVHINSKGIGDTVDLCRHLFPELRESEDERIRKWLCDYISNCPNDNFTFYGGVGKDAVLNYLEKQKEKRSSPKFKVGDTIHCKYDEREFTIKSVDLEKRVYKYTQEGCGNDIDYADEDFELVEQKPAERVEINKSLSDAVITELDKYNGENYWKSPWAIDSTGLQYPLYFANLGATWQKKQKLTEWSYDNRIQYASVESGIKAFASTYSFNIESKLFPQLTKEQQQLWREEIEQAVIAGGENGVELARDNRYKENRIIEWSEEDKSFYDSIICEVIKEGMCLTPEQVKWFKSLPERFNFQPKQEWNEEDEKMRANAILSLQYLIEECPNADFIDSVKKEKAWLKSLRPQWKPSEQEKGALRTAIHILTEERNFPKAASHLQAILDAFEGKESRKDWKPSKEQMEALKRYSPVHHPDVHLVSLYDDLKKLM